MKIITINRHRINTDGKGVTTLIALSSCPLRCKYCINRDILSINKIIDYTIEQTFKEVMQDYCYFIATDGGVCFGGGEPLLQSKDVLEFAKLANNLISINIETSLNVKTDIEDIINNVDKLIIDIKDINNEIYKKYTGVDNSILLQNLNLISSLRMQDRCKIRIPLIKDYNTDEDRKRSEEYVRRLGFEEIDLFEYIIRDIQIN